MPQGTPTDGYVLPFDRLGLDRVPIKGFTHSTGSVTFSTTCADALSRQATSRNVLNDTLIITIGV
jgi:hypothetical protein